MKSFAKETNLTAAQEILEAVPLVMRYIREQMRLNRGAGLSVPQFRALTFIKHNAGASLSGIAGYLGLALPSISKLVEGLVAKGFVIRRDDTRDRRRVALNLTLSGEAVLASARLETLPRLAERLSGLTSEECATVVSAARIMRAVFGAPRNLSESDLLGQTPKDPPEE
jgi:DNA-binding MarR family transcriptional regulator